MSTSKTYQQSLADASSETRPPMLERVFHMAQQSIPCSPKCKIVGQILLDHPLSYALTATADVPVVYLQQFWRTVSKVPSPEDTIKFMLNTQEFIYTVDMVGYQGVVDKVSAFYTKNLAQPWQTMFKKFSEILQRIEEDYHSIKDDIPLVSVYTTGDVRVRGMLILDAFLTEEIRAIDDFKEYETVFMNVDVPMNQPQPVVSTQGTHRSTPSAHKTPTLTTSPQGKKRKQSAGESSSPQKSLKITIRQQKVVEREHDDDDSEDRLEPGSHKDNPEHVDDETMMKRR
ncbi:hypothetical protein Tco_1352718 [Tanacetum coccineum]